MNDPVITAWISLSHPLVELAAHAAPEVREGLIARVPLDLHMNERDEGCCYMVDGHNVCSLPFRPSNRMLRDILVKWAQTMHMKLVGTDFDDNL